MRVLHSYLVEAEVGDDCHGRPVRLPAPRRDARRAAPRRAASSRSRTRRIGEGAKVPHLSYVGDAEVGAGANVGAGSITANYDGFAEEPDEDRGSARISVNTSLVAPVSIGDDAYTGAGAVIREDVPDGALGVSSNEQRNIEGYAERKASEASKEAGATD